MNMETVEVVAAAIVQGSKVLAGRRSPTKNLPGMWELPGGKVEDKESHSHALQRELREELGIIAEVGEHVASTFHEASPYAINLHTYLVRCFDGEIEIGDSHDDLKWIDSSDLARYEWAPADVEVIYLLEKYLS